MFIAIDIGSGLTKVVTERTAFTFPSAGAVCKDDKVFDDDVLAHEVIFWQNKRYVVGHYAYAMLKPEDRENAFSKSYYLKDIQKIFLYSAIAQVYPDGFVGSLALATGLPISVFSEGQKAFTEALVGTHVFTNKDNVHYEVTFHDASTKVLPQAVGLHFANIAKHPKAGHNKAKVGYLDPGTYTFGFSCIEDNRYIHRDSGGFQVGLEKLAKKMIPVLKSQHGWEPRHIEDVLRALRIGKIDIFDRSGQQTVIDMKTVAEICVPEVYGKALHDIANTWDAQNMRVFVSSGGGEYILKACHQYFPQAKLMHPSTKKVSDFNQDAILDVVNGYAVFANNLVKHIPEQHDKIVKIG
jgi:hypothetical protein